VLIRNPTEVSFGARVLDGVEAIVIDRSAAREVSEFDDFGAHLVFADVPEQRVTIRVVRELVRDGLDDPKPGDEDDLSFSLSPNAGDARTLGVLVHAVVLRVAHELRGQHRATQTITMLGVSTVGNIDPVVLTGG